MKIYTPKYPEILRPIPIYDRELKVTGVREGHHVPPEMIIHNEDSDVVDLRESWSTNLCHFMFDALPNAMILQTKGYKKAIILPNSVYQHVRDWVRLIGIPDIELRIEEEPVVGARRLENPWIRNGLPLPEMVMAFQDYRKRGIEAYGEPQNLHLFIQRGAQGMEETGGRNVVNRREIIDKFQSKGIHLTVVYLENTPVLQQIAWFACAKTVIAVHGAAMANLAFCQPGCKVIEIVSPLFWNHTYLDIASILSLRYAAIRGEVMFESKDLYRHCLKINEKIVWKLFQML